MNLSKQDIERCKQRLEILLPQYKKAIQQQNLLFAKSLIADIGPLFRKAEKTASLVEAKNALYELAIEKGEASFAIDGLIGNRKLVNKRTRLYLEATALLAIAYLQVNDFEKAKPCIKEVLQNGHVIKTKDTRRKFNEEIIRRFDEESVLFSLRERNIGLINVDEIHASAVVLAKDKNEDQLFVYLGSSLPQHTKNILFQVDEFSKKQLTYEEQKLLPSPQEVVSNEKAGKTAFASFKRVLYNSICDPKSEVYKGWYTNAVGLVSDKKFITGAVIATLSGIGIGTIALIISAVALLLRFGLDVYCDMYKPAGVTEIRRKK